MNFTSILILVISALIGLVMSAQQSINSCRKWFVPRTCRSRGCYWSWDDYECYPFWYNPNGGSSGSGPTRRRRIGSTFIGSNPR